MKKHISYKIVSLVFSILVICFAIAFYVVAWDEPGTPPPSGNVSAPLNTGDTTQYKSGALGIGGLFETDDETHLAILGGNVGIGTTGPVSNLDVRGANSNTWNKPSLSVSEGDDGYVMLHGNVTAPAIIWDSDLPLRFGTGGSSMANPDANWSEKMRILANGNVGIGTTNPLIDLAIGDTDTGINQDGDGVLELWTNNVDRLHITNSGNVGIGTTNPGTNKLEVVGGPIKATGGLIIETRTTNPGSPATGQMWLCTDPAPYCE